MQPGKTLSLKMNRNHAKLVEQTVVERMQQLLLPVYMKRV
jgi:hypothetical protein